MNRDLKYLACIVLEDSLKGDVKEEEEEFVTRGFLASVERVAQRVEYVQHCQQPGFIQQFYALFWAENCS